MRILKYLFLLLLLALFATVVFIATQKGAYDVSRSAIIKSPKSTVFNYVNDYRNWETFGSWKKEDPDMIFNYSKSTIGKGGSYSWSGSDGEGNMTTLKVVDNQMIHQKMDYNGSISDVYWTFKDTLGGTKVTWQSKGKMNFGFKIYSFFNGGVNNIIGNMYEKSLVNLDKTLDYELNTHSVNINGIVTKKDSYYLKQTITSKISNVSRNLRVMIPKMVHFFKKNNLDMYGNPFVIYHTYEVGKGITRFSVCIPIKEEVFISEGSDISSGKLYAFQAVKTTLKGDYAHRKKAWDKTSDYIKKNNLTQNISIPIVEIYSKNMVQIANPSQWVTEIYFPINAKAIVISKPKDTVNVSVSPKVEEPTTKDDQIE